MSSRHWFYAMRPKTLVAGLCPVILGSVLAYTDHVFFWPIAILCGVCALLIQVGTNFANDYFDFKNGADTTERVGPTRLTQAGLISPQSMKWAFILTFAGAACLGLFLVSRGGLPILGIGVFSLIFGYLYTGGPFPLGYVGLGDLLVWIFFGPVATAGTYYLQSLQGLGHSLGFGAALGFYSVAILAVNNLRDVDEDRKTGKRTLAVRFGPEFAKWEYMLAITFGSLLPGLLYGHLSPLTWMGGLAVIPSLLLTRVVWHQKGAILNSILAKTGILLVFFTLLCVMSLLVSPIHGEASPARLVAQATAYHPQAATPLAIHISIPEGWHTYGPDPGEIGAPPQFEWMLPTGSRISMPIYPPTKRFNTLGFKQNGYDREVTFRFNAWLASSNVPIRVKVKWLICKDTCKPQTAALVLALKPTDLPLQDNSDTQVFFKSGLRVGAGSLTILFIAFIGGILLNIMPCVFPVLSLKLLQLSENPPDRLRHSFAYTAGIVVSFWVLAGVLLGLKSAGAALGWGFQLQSPLMLVGLATLFWGIALNLFGVFEWGLSFTRVHTQKTGVWGSFLTGVLSTLVATPCTAPFVGSALGVALTQPGWTSWAIFTLMALGLAFPYVLIASIPGVYRFLPKPGAWMLRFKQFMGFPMSLTVLWILWILSFHVTATTLILVMGALSGVGLGLWIYGLSLSKWRWMGFIIAVGVFLGSLLLVRPVHTSSMSWIPYSAQTLQSARQSGHPVLVAFSAAWCATCKFNEIWVLHAPDIEAFLKRKQVVLIKADWTQKDPQITQALADYGRNAVPVYLYFAPGKAAVLLPELLSKRDILRLDAY